MKTTRNTAEARQLCTFFLHGLYLGVAVTRVQEVIRYQDLTVVPLAPESVRGGAVGPSSAVTRPGRRRRP